MSYNITCYMSACKHSQRHVCSSQGTNHTVCGVGILIICLPIKSLLIVIVIILNVFNLYDWNRDHQHHINDLSFNRLIKLQCFLFSFDYSMPAQSPELNESSQRSTL